MAMSCSTFRDRYLRAYIMYVPCKCSHIQQPLQRGTNVPCCGQGAALGKGRLLLLAVAVGAQGQGKGESLTSRTWGGLPGWAAHWRLTLLTSTCPTHVFHHGDNLFSRESHGALQSKALCSCPRHLVASDGESPGEDLP